LAGGNIIFVTFKIVKKVNYSPAQELISKVRIKIIIRKYIESIKKLITPGESLAEKTVKGGFWVFSLRIISRIFLFIRTVVLARVLAPEDFGTFGIALLLLSMLDRFSQTGFKKALIQKKDKTSNYLNIVWTIELIRGFGIAITIFMLAKPIAIFFNNLDAVNIIRAVGIVIILQSLNNVAVIYFEKELNFSKYFKYRFLATIVDMAVAIIAVFLLRNVWALVLGLLAGNLVQLIISYFIVSFKPKIKFDFKKTKELFGFGKWIFTSKIFTYLITDADDIFVGRVLGTSMLGFYQMGYKISNLSSTEIASTVSRVSFPAYSKLQDNLTKSKKAFLKILQFVTFLSFPIAGTIIALGDDFTRLFLGEKWIPMVPAMTLLALWGAIRSIGNTAGSLLTGIGRPDILTKVQMLQFFIIAMFIYPLSMKLGILGTALTIVISAVIMNLIRNHIIIKIFKTNYWGYYKVIAFPFIVTSISVFIVILIKELLLIHINIYYFILLSVIYIVTIIILYFLLNKFSSYKISSLFGELKKKLFK